jgi:hypothetical protein
MLWMSIAQGLRITQTRGVRAFGFCIRRSAFPIGAGVDTHAAVVVGCTQIIRARLGQTRYGNAKKGA